jgi:hypothetical protein
VGKATAELLGYGVAPEQATRQLWELWKLLESLL